MVDFEEYIKQGEPDKKEKGIIWQTAIGLQQVDGLTPSAYLIETAKQNIEGDITFEEVKNRIDSYYKTLVNRQIEPDDRTEEADKVSARIAEILSEKTFSFTPTEYIHIHRRLFDGIYRFAGKIRDYNITKSEWTLNGETVLYAGADNLQATLAYDFEQEKEFNYKGLSNRQIIEHIARFVAYLWQIHIFGEGNTRTTAVFLIKYLRKLGFEDINNDLFAKHSWYFRNALVRANYENITQNIHKTDEYLVRFLSNLLLNENNILKNRELHVDFVAPENVTVNDEKLLVEGINGGVNVTDVAENVTDVTDRISKIMALIKENNRITTTKMASILSVSKRTIIRDIDKLKQSGQISRKGEEKTGSWEIIKQGD